MSRCCVQARFISFGYQQEKCLIIYISHSPGAPLTLDIPVTQKPTTRLFSLPLLLFEWPCADHSVGVCACATDERGVLTTHFVSSSFRSTYKALRVCRMNTADARYNGNPIKLHHFLYSNRAQKMLETHLQYARWQGTAVVARQGAYKTARLLCYISPLYHHSRRSEDPADSH